MKLRVESNATEVAGAVGTLFRDQIPFAAAVAVNETAKRFQIEQREHQRGIFTVRRPRFVDRAVKIRRGDFATKREPTAIVRIEPPGGQERADILTKFEDQEFKVPFKGERLAIPVDVRRTGTGIVPPSMRPSSLDFKPHGSSGRVMRGKKRTFLIREPGGRGAIFQRFGRRGSSDVRVLFVFAPRADIDPELEFHANAVRVVRGRFPREFRDAFDRAIRTAR